jgi:nucleolar MIF4G domain-containing protein 1
VQHARDHDIESNGRTVTQPSEPKKPTQDDTRSSPPKPKSILKQPSKSSLSSKKRRSVSPPPKISRSVRDKLAEDDEEIAALERKLGLKGKKSLPKSFKEDGLDELLGGLDEDEDTDTQEAKKRKSEGDEWLKQKRKQAQLARGQAIDEDEDSEESGSEDSDMGDDGESEMSLDDPESPGDASEGDLSSEETGEDVDMADDFEGFDSDQVDSETEQAPPRVRENPYVAPSTGNTASETKYIPPALRKQSSDSEQLIRLRRQTQGLINRLTEANLISILGEIEKLYRDNARQHVTSVLVDILLTSVCEPTSLPDTLIILPAGFIAAVYKIIGTDFGAQIVQRIVELFTEHYQRAVDASQQGSTSDSSKETSNLIMLLSEMFNFQVVGSNLMFDYIRMLLETLSELNAELLLKMIRTSGPQLRQDDPSALKDIVTLLRPSMAKAGEENISVRTKFMIETINDLKNNKMKTGTAASAVTSEHTVRMKKILGTLNTRNIKGSEPLRIGLKDIQESDKKGKWWLVGASWSGPSEGGDDTASAIPTSLDRHSLEDPGTSDLSQLAREQRMNTEIRRGIFVAIMSASDYQDAYMRITKLQLKRKQEFEIPKVLIHCAGAEKSYNPYYTLIAKRLCGDVKLKKSFQFSLWDIFKKMGESDDDEDADDDYNDGDLLDTRQIVNLAKMFGSLIVEGGLGLGVLKNLSLSYLQPKTKTFVEVLFITLLLQSQKQAGAGRDEQAVVNTFVKLKDAPELIRGVQYFLKKVVSKSDITGGKEQQATVKWACKVAAGVLQELVAAGTTDE